MLWFATSRGEQNVHPLIKGDNESLYPVIINNAVRISDSDQMYQIGTSEGRNSSIQNNILLMGYQMSTP